MRICPERWDWTLSGVLDPNASFLPYLRQHIIRPQSHLALNVERMAGMPQVCPQLPYLWLLFRNPFPLEQPARPDIPLFQNSAAFPRDKHQQQQPRTLDPATRLNELEWRKGAGLVFPTEFTHPSASATPTDLFKVFRPKNGLLK